MCEVFLDTGYVIALAVAQDQHHSRARELAGQIRSEGLHVVTTRAMAVEIGNYLSRPDRRGSAIEHLDAIERSSAAEVIPLTEDLYRRGFALYRERPDKEWSLTDCISFVVMRERGITDALTADRHFEQAGFNALLRR